MRNLHAKQVLGYVVLPGIVPRVKALFASGFGYIAFMMASIYGMVRLLPPTHPYLNPSNTGKFGVRHVIAEAANHLVLKKENIDQLIIFAALLAGAVLLIMQFVMLGISILIPQAHAQIVSIFATPFPRNDMAFLLLDHVFGVPRFFCTGGVCSAIQGTLPIPFHDALHALFQFYSYGLLGVGVLIFLYFVIVVVVETAVSGSPFGQRFDNIWAPIRLVVALALLIPVNWGLNSAQYITLFAAKMGSGFATNAWLTFNDTIINASNRAIGGSNPSGEGETLVALPKSQDAAVMVQMMSLVHTCAYAYWRVDTSSRPAAAQGVLDSQFFIKPYLVKYGIGTTNTTRRLEVTATTTYQEALEFYDNGDITIVFGEAGDKFKSEKGQVNPLCGSVRVKATPLSDSASTPANLSGAEYISMRYFDLIKQMWFSDVDFQQFALRYVERTLNKTDWKKRICGQLQPPSAGCSNPYLPACSGTPPDCETKDPAQDWKQNANDRYQVIMNADLLNAWRRESNNPKQIDQELLKRGWAGAGIWYNSIAEMNGAFMGAVLNLPNMPTFPKVMEEVRAERMKQDSEPTTLEQFSPTVAAGSSINLKGGANDLSIARALNNVYQFWNNSDQNQAVQEKTHTSNTFESIINVLFGVSGLLDIRGENSNIHPLAQLVAVGKGLVDGAIRNIAISAGFSFMGGALSANESTKAFGKIAGALAQLANSASFVGLTAGLVLFYVLPFLPFVYFYFTVGTWIKTIFEAMVGVPLWALAHLRLDGNGLPGEAAMNGYFLIFEIFIRPILAIFGLIAGILIFTAQVRILNFIWDIVTQNAAGFSGDPTIGIIGDIEFKRTVLDQFFFTVIYTIIVYMLAIASFKLIDRIPDNILRWMGAGVSSFSDINEDPTEGLKRYVAMGGLTFGQQITGGISEAAGGLGGTFGGLFKGNPPSAPSAGTGRTPAPPQTGGT